MTAPRTGVYICHCGTNIAGIGRRRGGPRLGPREPRGQGRRRRPRLPLHVLEPGPGAHRAGHQGARPRAHRGGRLLTAHAREDLPRGQRERRPQPLPRPSSCPSASRSPGSTPTRPRPPRRPRPSSPAASTASNEHVPLEPLVAPVNPATLIVGGGIAGITAALEIADAGYPGPHRGARAVHRRPHGPVRQDLPDARLRGLHPDAAHGGRRAPTRTSRSTPGARSWTSRAPWVTSRSRSSTSRAT